jgi:uncharacterized protein involved in exopolysaccharide biosynthesis
MFRKPLLVLVPAVLIPILVAVGAYATTRHYEVSASMWAQVPSVSTDGGATLRSPAASETQRFQERMDTEAFRNKIITAAGLDDKVASGEWPPASDLGRLLSKTPITKPIASALGLTAPSDAGSAHDRALQKIKSTLSIEAKGDNLVRITYRGEDPDTGVALVNAAYKTYQDEEASSSAAQAQAVLGFYEDQVAKRKSEVEDADAALTTFQAQNPETPGVSFPVDKAQELTRLRAAYEVSLGQYQDALSRLSEVQARADASASGQQANFSLVDPPTAPDGPTLDVSRAVTLVFMGLVFGVGVGSALVLVSTWSDQTLRRVEDVEQRLRVAVLASLPLVGKGS